MTAAACPNCRCRDMGGADWWHEDGRNSFRFGKFLVVLGDDCDTTSHDDFPEYRSMSGRPEQGALRGALNDKHDDFLTWHAATCPPAPTEPTKDGFVGTLLSNYGSTHHVYRYLDHDGHAYRIVGLAGGSEAHTLSWGVVLQAGTFTAVTS